MWTEREAKFLCDFIQRQEISNGKLADEYVSYAARTWFIFSGVTGERVTKRFAKWLQERAA